ncbi:electron transfer flavoprotein subunit beta/FixA family protein [Actinomycetaceae bacterium TAE3-ERU4]|nr:electron transfer flavoprotein subunit beta/FixA family protein [Actinomycetaceae bacterium TAE3-ERU4]
MRIAVCVKHVPDVQSERRLEDGTMVRGEDDVLNELDENAVEAAVATAEVYEGSEVVAFTMGPEGADEALTRALQMGATRGVMISDDLLAGSDVFATAQVLAGAILAEEKDDQFDLVFTGMASLDAMTSMLPAALASLLGRPFIGLASEIEVAPNSITARRVADGFDDRLRAPFPAVVSVTDQVNDPRYPNFKAMAAARKKTIDEYDVEELRERLEEAGVSFEIKSLGKESSGTNVLSADAVAEREEGQIVTDTGDGGTKLAAYISEVLGK